MIQTMQNQEFTRASSDPTSAETAGLIRNFYAAFGAGVEQAAALVSADCVLHVPGAGRNAGEYWGPDGFRRFMGNILAHNGGRFALQVLTLAVNGGDVFARELVTLNRRQDPAREWRLRFVMHYKVKAGAISEVWVVPEDQRLYDEYWAPEAAERNGAAPVLHLPRSAAPEGVAPEAEGVSSARNLAHGLHFYEMFWRGEQAALQRIIADDVVVDIRGRGDLSGSYAGWLGFLRFRAKLNRMIGERYKLEIDSIAANDDEIWVKEYIRMDRRWDPAIMTSYVIMRFALRDGKIVAIDDFPIDTYAWERAFSEPAHLHSSAQAGAAALTPQVGG